MQLKTLLDIAIRVISICLKTVKITGYFFLKSNGIVQDFATVNSLHVDSLYVHYVLFEAVSI